MDAISQIEDDDIPPVVLAPLLDFTAFSMEEPALAATRIALGLSLAAVGITLFATLLGVAAGAGLALAYAASGWAMALYLVKRENGVKNDP